MSASASIDPETPTSATPIPNEEISMVDNPVKEEDKQEQNGKPIDVEKAKSTFQEKAKNYLIDQSSHIVIPSFAKWFSMNDVHSIEKKLFPDFFPVKDGDEYKSIYKTGEIYKNMRDFMINSYRINPLEYLTVTAIRRNLAGDVSSIIRIHHFLEKWGLINYQIDPRTKSTVVGPQYTGHFQVTLDTPKGLVPFIPDNIEVIESAKDLPSPPNSVENETNENDYADHADLEKEQDIKVKQEIPINMEVRRNIYTNTNDVSKNINTQNIIQYFCNTCGKDSSEVRYHNLKSKSYSNNPNSNINNASVLCSTCFDQGLFPLNFQSSDFVKLQKSNDNIEWSEQEILLLLEGIEMFGTFDASSNNANVSLNSNANGQWDKISEFIGTKTKEQCLIKFIQLPIEDRYLNKLINSNKKDDTFNQEKIVQDIVSQIISNKSGQALVEENSLKSLNESISEQSNLINQITELTLEKFQIKMNNLNNLESNLIEVENSLNLERKQLLIERWSNFEKINKFKKSQENLSPELNNLLNDLLTPINVNEINKSFGNNLNLNNDSNKMDVDSSNNLSNSIDNDSIPVSIAKPKNYQFWSG